MLDLERKTQVRKDQCWNVEKPPASVRRASREGTLGVPPFW